MKVEAPFTFLPEFVSSPQLCLVVSVREKVHFSLLTWDSFSQAIFLDLPIDSAETQMMHEFTPAGETRDEHLGSSAFLQVSTLSWHKMTQQTSSRSYGVSSSKTGNFSDKPGNPLRRATLRVVNYGNSTSPSCLLL